MTIDNIMHKLDDRGTENATEEQMAAYVAKLLNDETQQLPAFATQHLRAARHLAVSQLALQQAQTYTQNGNVLRRLGHQLGAYWEQHRNMSAALIFLALLLTFLAAEQFVVDTNVLSSDALLLASDLPPEAYADKGFDTWLEANLN